MSRVYAEILASATSRFTDAAEGMDPRHVGSVIERIVEDEIDLDIPRGPDHALAFLNANPPSMQWVTDDTTSSGPIWLTVKETVKEHLAQDLFDVVASYRLASIGNVGDLISKIVDFSAHVALDVMPEAVPGYFDVDMKWTTLVGSKDLDDVRAVVLGALDITEAFQPISQGSFNPAVLFQPWSDEAAGLLRDMEILRLVIAHDPRPIYEYLQNNDVTRQHSYGKVRAR